LRDLLSTLNERLSVAERDALMPLVRLAAAQQTALYLVGGSVRDLLLSRPNVDLDIAVEGDAHALARALGDELECRVVLHKAFGTASLESASFHIDLARTRAETYAQPGALPSVSPASIDDDLRRRDFTVNALALRLTPPDAGALIDPFSGERDLAQRLIRVLHNDSFRDDATRMLRAIRYEVRLSFRLEAETTRLLERDLAYLDTISGTRLLRELVGLFYEERPHAQLARCRELGLLPRLYPCLQLDKEGHAALLRAEEERPAPWDEVCLCILCRRCEASQIAPVSERLAFPKRYTRALEDTVRLREAASKLTPPLPPSEVVDLLEAFSPASVWALALLDDGASGQKALRFLREWRQVKPFLSARSLKRLGVSEGPELGEMLRRLRAARLDGRTKSREDELSLIDMRH